MTGDIWKYELKITAKGGQIPGLKVKLARVSLKLFMA
jgi:hypothetical protein